jgi:hypothetical protein
MVEKCEPVLDFNPSGTSILESPLPLRERVRVRGKLPYSPKTLKIWNNLPL